MTTITLPKSKKLVRAGLQDEEADWLDTFCQKYRGNKVEYKMNLSAPKRQDPGNINVEMSVRLDIAAASTGGVYHNRIGVPHLQLNVVKKNSKESLHPDITIEVPGPEAVEIVKGELGDKKKKTQLSERLLDELLSALNNNKATKTLFSEIRVTANDLRKVCKSQGAS